MNVRALSQSRLFVFTFSWGQANNKAAGRRVPCSWPSSDNPGVHLHVELRTREYCTTLDSDNPGLLWMSGADKGMEDAGGAHKHERDAQVTGFTTPNPRPVSRISTATLAGPQSWVYKTKCFKGSYIRSRRSKPGPFRRLKSQYHCAVGYSQSA